MLKLQGFSEDGGKIVVTAGISSTTVIQKSYPLSTITVYLAGTVTLATLYSDDGITPKANPFTAAADGEWFFYAADGRYDVKFSGTGIPTPFTLGDFGLIDPRDPWSVRIVTLFPGAELGAMLAAAYNDLPTISGYKAGILFIPQGSYSQSTIFTSSSPYVSVLGAGKGATTITCSANQDCMRFTANPFTGEESGIVGGFSMLGNAGASAAGIHVSGITGLVLRDLTISNFTAGVGLWLDNGAAFSDATANFTERTQTHGVWLNNNKTGLRFSVQAAATSNSFFYSNFKAMHFNVNSGQTGVKLIGTGVAATSPYVFNSNIEWQYNCVDGPTFLDIGSAVVVEGNVYDIVGETTSGAQCTPLANAGFIGGIGQFKSDNSSAPTGAGTIVWRDGYFGINANQVIENPNTLSARVQSGAGTYMTPNLGVPGSYKGCFGIRAHFDGTNWVTEVIAGINNGAAIVCEDGTALQFFFIPSTGATPQTISTAGLAAYERAFVKAAGFFFGPETGGGAPASLMLSATASLNFGTINANTCTDLTFGLTGAVSTDSYFVTTAAAPPAGIFFNVFGGSASAPVVRACNVTVAPVVVGTLTMRVDAWRH